MKRPVPRAMTLADCEITQADIDRYMALPDPLDLPSGLPNLWSWRVHRRKLCTPAGEAVRSPVIWGTMDWPPSMLCEISDVDIAPFNIKTMAPFFDQYPSTALGSVLSFPVPDPKNYQPSNYESMTIALIRALLPVFLPKDAAKETEQINPRLMCALPPLGTFRPRRLIVHDVNLFNYIHSFCEAVGIQAFCASLRLATVELVRSNTMHNPLVALAYCTMLSCSACHKIGADREGHGHLEALLKCSGCGVIW